MEVTTITDDQTRKLLAIEEGQFADLKSEQIAPKSLTKTISAFSNSDGGELYIGISEAQDKKTRVWSGFENQEAANAHVQVFEELFPLGTDFRY